MAMSSRLYFAYGLNMNRTEFERKCSRSVALKAARLPGYRLAYYEYTPVWDGGMETIVPDETAEIWGVLYQVDEADWEELDRSEDARMDGTGAYFHYPVEVVDETQTAIAALVYLKARWGQTAVPGQEYMNLVIEGAKNHGLPEVYVQKLRNIETKQAAYPVPRRPAASRFACGDSCDGCI